MSKVAVVKPDHLGDLILSSPAIRAAQRHFDDLALFVSDGSRHLARFLFPDIELRTINFPHLSRQRECRSDLDGAARALNEFDLVLWLRDDPFIRSFASTIMTSQDFASGSHLAHETAIQKRMMLRHVENYSRTKMFSGATDHWPKKMQKVGLCIGSGFPTNRWPNIFWLECAAGLSRADIQLVLIAGPGEAKDATFLARLLKGKLSRTVLGGMDFRSFLDDLEDLDAVVATDGGSAHICSLAKPVLSIFGSSPWRRYAPFGRENIVITRDLSCSPCCNFSMEEVNGCMTRECIIGIDAEAVCSILVGNEMTPQRLIVQRGTSHAFEE